MKPFIAACTLTLTAFSATTHAAWPWEDSGEDRPDYCRGVIVAGLAEFPIEDLSRTNLWLGWNGLTRNGIHDASTEQYQQGKQAFADLLASGDLESLRQLAQADCADHHS